MSDMIYIDTWTEEALQDLCMKADTTTQWVRCCHRSKVYYVYKKDESYHFSAASSGLMCAIIRLCQESTIDAFTKAIQDKMSTLQPG